MQAHRGASTNGRAPLVKERAAAPSELEELRATCRRQASVIETLGEAISVLRAGAGALKAENTDLRADTERLRQGRETGSTTRESSEHAGPAQVRLALDVHAPAAARAAVAGWVRGRVSASAFDLAQLLTSELVTNSVQHSHASTEAALLLRLELSGGMVRLEVEDPGRDGAVAARPPDLDGGGGFGLDLVQRLAERWGVERVAAGGNPCLGANRVTDVTPRAGELAHPPTRSRTPSVRRE
jgi:anti-sigma regulatory factor (Ser/Thr protein kinase)